MRAAAAVVVLLPAVALAQPAIESLDGSAADGATLRIRGSGFGTRGPTPIAWDDFEAGAVGDPPAAPWVAEGGIPEGAPAIDSSLPRRGSKRSLLASFSDTNEVSRFGVDRALDEVFLSFWRQVRLTGSFTRTWTAVRLEGASATGHPAWRHELQGGDAAGGAWAAGATDDVACGVDPAAMAGTGDGIAELQRWIREDYWLRASTPGAVDGWMEIWRDHVPEIYTAWSAEVGRDVRVGPPVATRCGEDGWSAIRIGETWSREPGGQAVIWYDDVYLDETPARVEIGNAPTWAAVTSSEIQPSTAWSDGEVEIQVNAGALYSGYDYWLYVFDETNTPSEGYLFTIGDPYEPGEDAGPDASISTPRGPAGCGCRSGPTAEGGLTGACLTLLFLGGWRHEKAHGNFHHHARVRRCRGELPRGVQGRR